LTLYTSTNAEKIPFYPTLMGSKTPTSKFSESKEVRWGSTAHKSPIGSTNNQCGMKRTPTD
ncbi:hypothetical protein P4U12_19945, partial [Bacillus paranthracis]|uniref:hypothetical protein n=1 Tax=Bacillus paranthracis TaxID=2026186 RepID=UPI002E1B14EC|nr:hypothetical protein [Bacillus paranthracis]